MQSKLLLLALTVFFCSRVAKSAKSELQVLERRGFLADLLAPPVPRGDWTDTEKFYGDAEEIAKMLNKRPGILKKNSKYRQNALMAAAEQDHVQLAQLLIDNGINVNVKLDDGKTALMVATENSSKQVLNLLLANGAQ